MTGKDDPTISWIHLMVELSILAGWKIILKGEVWKIILRGVLVTTPPLLVDKGKCMAIECFPKTHSVPKLGFWCLSLTLTYNSIRKG